MIKSILAAAALAAISTGGIAQTTTPQTADHAAAHHAPLPTINSTIKDLLANPATAAVLEKHLPGVSQHPALPQVQDMTLAQVAPLSGGLITQEIISKIDTDLKALPAS